MNLFCYSPTKRLKDPDCTKVPSSPSLLQRSILMSPGKTHGAPLPYISPRKLFTEASPTKSFERYSHLSTKEKSSLVLPYKYRTLAETFRAVDAVVSMMFNRNETIFFSKLKTSVQQMSKKYDLKIKNSIAILIYFLIDITYIFTYYHSVYYFYLCST